MSCTSILIIRLKLLITFLPRETRNCMYINEHLPAAKERELVTVVNLVNLAMQRLPAAFTNQECSTALALLSQLTTLLVDTELR